MSQRILTNEVLPEESSIAWDLSDLQGVTIVDDTTGNHNLPEPITVEELTSKGQFVYLLETIPDSFSLEVSILPTQSTDEQFFYLANYTKGEDY